MGFTDNTCGDCRKKNGGPWNPDEQSPTKREKIMHYRNGREAKNGDKIVMLGGYGSGATIVSFGVLFDATPGNDHCNGTIAPAQNPQQTACLCDCLHVDDLADILREKGLDQRPKGK
jgi:hypothetical protein